MIYLLKKASASFNPIYLLILFDFNLIPMIATLSGGWRWVLKENERERPGEVILTLFY